MDDNQFFEVEIIPGYMYHTEQYGMLRVVITRRRNCERIPDAIEIMRHLADTLEKVNETARIKPDGFDHDIAKWLVDHIAINTYEGSAVAYLRQNI